MKIGFTCSTFDLFHAGHIMMLKEARTQCDYLIVGMQTDPTIDRDWKNKPIQSVFERFTQLQACKYVDEVYENADLITTDDLLNKLRADYVFAGREEEEYIKKYYQVSKNKLILLDRTSHICTSDIINRIIKNR